MNRTKVYRDFWLFFAATTLAVLSIDIFVFNLGWYLLEIGGHRPAVGFSWGIFFIPGVFMLPIIRKLTEARKLRLGLLSFEIAKALLFLMALYIVRYVRTVESIYIFMGLLGCAFAPFYPVSYSVLKQLFQDKSVVRFSNLFEVALQLAGALALFASGYILKALGFFTLTAVAFIASAGAAFLYSRMSLDDAPVENTINTSKPAEKINIVKLIYGFLHTYPQVSVLLLNIPLLLYVEKIMEKGPVEYGILDAVAAVISLLGGSLWAYFSKASSKSGTLLSMGLLTTLCYFIAAFISPTVSVLPYVLFSALGFFTTSAKVMARGQLMLTHSAEEVAKYNPIYQFTANLTLVLGAFSFGHVIRVFSVEACLAILGVGYLIFSISSYIILGQRNIQIK